MAEALLGVVVEATISKVMAIAREQINLAWGFKDELQELHSTLELLNAFLQDAEQRKRSTDDPPVKLWLQGLAEIASDADDVLEDIRYESLRRQVEVGRKLHKKVSNFFSALNPVMFRIKMGNRIKDINASFEHKNSKASQLGLQARPQPVEAANQALESHGFIGDSQPVIGREADHSKVVDLLIQSSSSTSGRPLEVVTVLGMPGVGKTVLAKLAFNDERLRSHFDEMIWVCVSETFDVKLILKRTLECLNKDENVASSDSKQKMLMKLQEKLADKKYLLVLDDVWNRDSEKWNQVLEDFLGISRKATECVILATTRDMEVATTMATEFTYRLETVEDEACWSIIKGIAISSDHILISNDLEMIGRDIARKCKGLPLLAKVIGGTLRKERSEHAWASIQKSDLWYSLESKNQGIGRVLHLSFDRLDSSCLKKCFAYCSIFPDDYRFIREDLIQLWMAAGFIHPSAHHNAWSVGNQYFNDLVSNSLFQDFEWDSYGSIITCKMHDLIHNFAKSLSKATILTSSAGIPSDVSHICHLNLDGKETTLAHSTLKLVSRRNLQSLFVRFNIFQHNGVEFTRLRILSFVGADIEHLPSCIGKLKRLTYFDISRSAIKEIPTSFTKLYNLDTFKLVKCPLNKLPKQMSNLVNLSHLVFDNKKELVLVNIGRLTRLQTLPLFVVGSKRGYGIEELGSLTRLQGKLEISKLELVRGGEQAKMAKLVEKKEICELVFKWSSSRENEERDEVVLEGLQPNSSLKCLKIINYEGHQLPSWLSSAVCNSQFLLGNLMELELKSCNNCEKLPSLGQLPILKHLYISGLNNVRSIDKDFFCNGNFSSLKTLSISYMRILEDLMEVEPTTILFPSLEDLRFSSCSKLKGIPWTDGLPSLQRLEIVDCQELSYLRDGLSSFVQLKWLCICRCRNLKSIPSPWVASSLEFLNLSDCEEVKSASMLENQSYTSLKHLTFKCCPRIRSEVEWMLGQLSCLETLSIDIISPNEVWEFAQFSISLECLQLDGYKEGNNIKSLPYEIQKLTTLKRLMISNFISLEDLPEWSEKLHPLQVLFIYNCPNLKNVQCLARMLQLKFMHISPCFDQVDFPPYFNSIFESLPPSLEELSVNGSRLWTCLPSKLQCLSTLKILEIAEFGRMEALPEWIGNLSSLEHLKLSFCKNIMYMPSQHSMHHLSKLKYLSILYCPKLEERCTMHSGSEWSKISHIPYIQFTSDIIQDI